MNIYQNFKNISFMKTLFYSIFLTKRLNIFVYRKSFLKIAKCNYSIEGPLLVGKVWNGCPRAKTILLAEKNTNLTINGSFEIYSGCNIVLWENSTLKIGGVYKL